MVGKIPDGWASCPSIGNVVQGTKFVPFKVPLKSLYDVYLDEEDRFQCEDVVYWCDDHAIDLGLVINLTWTKRYYDEYAFARYEGIKAVKYIQCRGRGESPSETNIQEFIETCRIFWAEHPNKYIGVHCTHGFNRTGFLIAAYMVEVVKLPVMDAIHAFKAAREPGIYKQEYIQDFFARYVDAEYLSAIEIPQVCVPEWKLMGQPLEGSGDEDAVDGKANEDVLIALEGEEEYLLNKYKFEQEAASKPIYMTGMHCDCIGKLVVGDEADSIRESVRKLCNYPRLDFPGSQPVSLDKTNSRFLLESEYTISWKADGTRYMLYIDEISRKYMIDRDFRIFEVDLYMPKHQRPYQIINTLLDGEMVIDMDPETKTSHSMYLIYDVVCLNGIRTGDLMPNYLKRLDLVITDVIKPRKAINAEYAKLLAGCQKGRYDERIVIKNHVYDFNLESFKVGIKVFRALPAYKEIVSIRRKITHHSDGYIFCPLDARYVGGRFDRLLKWKPPEENSIDFLMQSSKVRDYEYGGQKHQPNLYVTCQQQPQLFASIDLSKQERLMYEGKIIECHLENGKWKFMRERKDKSHPNALHTARNVMRSIMDGVNEDQLMRLIQKANLFHGLPAKRELEQTLRHERDLIERSYASRLAMLRDAGTSVPGLDPERMRSEELHSLSTHYHQALQILLQQFEHQQSM